MKYAIDRASWSPEDREEFEQMLAEICGRTTDSAERIDLAEALLNDAVQGQRFWARQVERACLRDGLGAEIRRYEDRNRVMFAHDGRVLSMPAKQARRVQVDDGRTVFQRELIELWPWAQIEDKRAEAIRARRTYDDKVAHYDRLLALRVLCPDSASPDEAARQLGIDLQTYLARPAEAA
ncbi:hypothetical protein [Plantactinospora sp. WMMB782]|uniref:hypothetical protein n=1 Tax=Plantactinospora sp. WMMB782 TaxID=3404121 RepID=UPI003B93B7E1